MRVRRNFTFTEPSDGGSSSRDWAWRDNSGLCVCVCVCVCAALVAYYGALGTLMLVLGCLTKKGW